MRSPTGGNCLVSFDASGQQLIRSPKFSANVGGSLVVPTGLGELTANARMSYRDGFPWEPSGRVRENSNINVTAGLVLESVDKSWNIGVRGRTSLAAIIRSTAARWTPGITSHRARLRSTV